MQIKIFNIPIGADDSMVEDMNRFLRANKIIDIKKELAMLGSNSCWTFCITYMLDNKPADNVKTNGGGKIDYTEVLDAESIEICNQLIERCRHETDENTDRRNWVRPMFKEQVFKAFDQKVSEILIEIDKFSRLYKEKEIENVLTQMYKTHQDDDLLCFESEPEAQEAIDQCRNRLNEYIQSKEDDVSSDFWKNSYIKESVEKRVLEYCNTSLTKWIDYVMFREDIIHDSITDAAKDLIAGKMDSLGQMLDKIADDYIIMNYPPQI